MATNYVKCSYREIIDLHTEENHVTAIGVHTPTGDTPRRMFSGYFDQYKRYKYLGASIKFVPAARLPADPLQVSYGAGDADDPYTIDPRDLMNPILVHGCHGNDMGTILNKLYNENNQLSDGTDVLDDGPVNGSYAPFAELMERLYYKALTDNTWQKANVQRGFQKNGLRPLIYLMATDHQIMPSSQRNGMYFATDGHAYLPGGVPTENYSVNLTTNVISNGVSYPSQHYFTPRLTRLGWMDTRMVTTVPASATVDNVLNPESVLSALSDMTIDQINYAELEKLFMLLILLPPAYKTEVYFRCIITHRFAFKDFRGISFMPEVTDVPSYFNANESLSDPEKFEPIVPLVAKSLTRNPNPNLNPNLNQDQDQDQSPTM